MKKAIIAVLFLAGFAGAPVCAENGKYEVGLMPGFAIPVSGNYWGNSTTGVKSSFALAAYGDYRINDMFAAGLDIGYDFGHKAQGDNVTNSKTKMLQITPHGKIMKDMDMFGKKGKVYGVLGLGMYNLKFKNDDGDVQDADGNSSVTKFGFNLGGGADVEIAQNILLGLEVRWHHVFSALASTNDDGTISKDAVNNITPALKIAYTF
ncbi:MAG: porin family protein [Elusimicrobia bacterium]|nr:porin family protein [Elusimicrobiota bacterium]